jgi:hypothetical protein
MSEALPQELPGKLLPTDMVAGTRSRGELTNPNVLPANYTDYTLSTAGGTHG